MFREHAIVGGRQGEADDPYAGRRQADALDADDLRRHGVWWFPGPDDNLGGPDDLTVLPLDTGVADSDGAVVFPPGRFLLHARFVLADGTTRGGHVTFAADDAGNLRDREPTLCAGGTQIPLWHGVLVPSAAQVRDYLESLGRAHDQVFPLRWKTVYHPPGVTLVGEAAGFAVWQDGDLRYV